MTFYSQPWSAPTKQQMFSSELKDKKLSKTINMFYRKQNPVQHIFGYFENRKNDSAKQTLVLADYQIRQTENAPKVTTMYHAPCSYLGRHNLQFVSPQELRKFIAIDNCRPTAGTAKHLAKVATE
jgi:hypothetical protein